MFTVTAHFMYWQLATSLSVLFANHMTVSLRVRLTHQETRVLVAGSCLTTYVPLGITYWLWASLTPFKM